MSFCKYRRKLRFCARAIDPEWRYHGGRGLPSSEIPGAAGWWILQTRASVPEPRGLELPAFLLALLLPASLIAGACSQPGDWLGGAYGGFKDSQLPQPAPRSAMPQASLPAQTSLTPLTLALSSTDAGAVIRYTIDGSIPTATSSLYSLPLSLGYGSNWDLAARAWTPGRLESELLLAGTYVVPAQASMPVFSPTPGTFPGPMSITISSSGSEIRYLSNPTGTVPAALPTASDSLYAGPIALTWGQTLSLRAKAYWPGHDSSPDNSATYHVLGWVALPATFPIQTGSAIGLALDSAGQPLVTALDAGGRAALWSFTASAWGLLGGAALSAGPSLPPLLVLDSARSPLVAYTEGNPLGPGYLASWTGSAWSTSAAFSVGNASALALAYDTTLPLVAFVDSADGLAHLSSYSAPTWSAATSTLFFDGLPRGGPGLSALAYGPNGIAWRATDGGAGIVTIESDSGTGFAALATQLPAAWPFTALALAVDPSSQFPWVALAENRGATQVGRVLKWTGSAWASAAGAFYSAASPPALPLPALALAFDAAGKPWVAWEDGSGNVSVAEIK